MQQRGYSMFEIVDCILEDDGQTIVFDETHAAYPRGVKVVANGPGNELKKLLARIGITASPQCRCNKRAALMNARGCDWCEANIDTIVGWLREEAKKRGLPFLDAAGKMLVRRAIHNARTEASRARPPGSQVHDQG